MKPEDIQSYLDEKFSRIEELPHTADVKYRLFGMNLADAFELAGYVFTDTHADIFSVNPIESIEISVSAEDLGSLLFEFIDELIFILSTKFLLISYFENLTINEKDEGFILHTIAWGEELDPSRHDLRTEVKAMTYHDLSIKFEKDNQSLSGPVCITLLFDI
ncbi:MAG: archease [Candidatus Helarchaeota archaeon]